ncbi:MAG: NHLP-related RiPP peptide, partial [Solirubrobacteraceae bacterium]
MAAAESEIAAKLIERLLADPAFRDRFRRNPATACREAGLESLAEEMQLGAGKAMHTLDIRESRSSLAGVMMAAAMEGMGVYEFSKHVVPQLEDVSGPLGDVLSRVNLPALPGAGSLSGGPKASTAAVVPPP